MQSGSEHPSVAVTDWTEEENAPPSVLKEMVYWAAAWVDALSFVRVTLTVADGET